MLRIDASTLRSPEETEEGYVRAQGIIAAPGVSEYRTKSGEIVREYVPEETLRDEEFLQSLEGKPVTFEHPSEKVDPDNVQRHEVGNVRDVEGVDDADTNGTKGTVLLCSSDANEAFKSGTDELSPAYEVELEEGDGHNFDRGLSPRVRRNPGVHPLFWTRVDYGIAF